MAAAGRSHRAAVAAKDEEAEPRRRSWSKLEPELEEKKFIVDELTIQSRLEAITCPPVKIDLDDETAAKTISRQFFSYRYGGSSQSTFPKIGAVKKALHDIHHVAFMTLDWNPELPASPGEHGLAFCRHPEIYGSMPLFVRRKEHEWQYMGEYRLRKVESLSAEEWGRQSVEMRNTWLDEGYMKLSWGQEARARHVFRERHGRDPETKDEMEETKAITKSAAWSRVTRRMIEDDLIEGTEQIHVCALECMSYREDFQKELIRGFRGRSWRTFPKNSCRKRMAESEDTDSKDETEEEEGRDTKRVKLE